MQNSPFKPTTGLDPKLIPSLFRRPWRAAGLTVSILQNASRVIISDDFAMRGKFAFGEKLIDLQCVRSIARDEPHIAGADRDAAASAVQQISRSRFSGSNRLDCATKKNAPGLGRPPEKSRRASLLPGAFGSGFRLPDRPTVLPFHRYVIFVMDRPVNSGNPALRKGIES